MMDDEKQAADKMLQINNDSVFGEEKGDERQNKVIDRKIKMVLNHNDVYRVPLMWLMPDSKVDLFIMTQKVDSEDDQQDPLELFTDIQSLFNQSPDYEKINQKIQS